jgi:hypothetical protein
VVKKAELWSTPPVREYEKLKNQKRGGPLLDHLHDVEAACEKGDPTIAQIFKIFGADGHFVLIVFLILPFLQPVPLMGLSTPFGLLIGVVGVFALLRKPPLVPKRWADRRVSRKIVSRIAFAADRVLSRIGRWIHPRWSFLFSGFFRSFNLMILILSALLLSLPLPIPFSNAIPAWVVFLQALAHLEGDGLLVVGSYLFAIACGAYFVLLFTGAQIGLDALLKLWL